MLFKALDDKERERLYLEHLRDRERKEREEKRAERAAKMGAFKELLEKKNVVHVKVNSPVPSLSRVVYSLSD